MSRKVGLVQSLLDEDDAAVSLVVEPAGECVVEPLVDLLAAGLGECLVWFKGVVNDDEIGPTSRQGGLRPR
jgi:hypothetical protein